MLKPVEALGQMPDLPRHSKQGMLQEEMRTNNRISDMLNTNNWSVSGKMQRTILTSGSSAFLIRQGWRN